MKNTLRFREDGSFRILQLSDIQESLSPDPRTLPALCKLLDTVQPDLVMLGGDNCDGHQLANGEELRKYLNIFASAMDDRCIPWAHVFGNHDHDLPMDDIEQTRLYEEHPYCISSHTENIGGVTNFMLPVLASHSDAVAYAVWGLDSGNLINDTHLPELDAMIDYPHLPVNASLWDIVRFDQLMWYWNTSTSLEQTQGGKVPGILFMHISPWEFQLAVDNAAQTGAVGAMGERMGLGIINSGVFAAVLQRGDIRNIACGHSHEDDFTANICGIDISLDACAGYSPYGFDELRGGRLFIIPEDTGRAETRMVRYKDL